MYLLVQNFYVDSFWFVYFGCKYFPQYCIRNLWAAIAQSV
jgi:hypothetical protein